VQAQIVVIVRLYVGVVANATLSDLQASGPSWRSSATTSVTTRRATAWHGVRATLRRVRRRSGTLTLAPVEFAGELLGRGYFGRYRRTASEPMDLKILPSPPDAIPWLPASELTLSEQWPQDPPVFHAGEPLTRTLTITAKGLTAAQLPPLGGASVEHFKQYVDQPELNDQTADEGVTGVRREKIAFLQTEPGKYTLPAIEVNWWNTGTRSFEVVRVPERDVEVPPGTGAQAVRRGTRGHASAAAPAPATPIATAVSRNDPTRIPAKWHRAPPGR
jgi:hypothetical protein